MKFDTKTLADFIVDYKGNHSWASGAGETESNGIRKVVPFETNIGGLIWRFTDAYVTGEKDMIFQGFEKVCISKPNSKTVIPVWAMCYRGEYCGTAREKGKVNALLKKAISAVPIDAPFRGPKYFDMQKGRGVSSHYYQNEWRGNMNCFTGHELIGRQHPSKIVHRLDYFGGLIK